MRFLHGETLLKLLPSLLPLTQEPIGSEERSNGIPVVVVAAVVVVELVDELQLMLLLVVLPLLVKALIKLFDEAASGISCCASTPAGGGDDSEQEESDPIEGQVDAPPPKVPLAMVPFELPIKLETPEFHDPEFELVDDPLDEVCRLLRVTLPFVPPVVPLVMVVVVEVFKLILPEADGGGVGGVIIGVVPLLLAVESSYKPSLPLLLLDALVVVLEMVPSVAVAVAVEVVAGVVDTVAVVTVDAEDEVDVNWLNNLELE